MSTAGKVQKYVIKSINTLGAEVETTLSNKFQINPNAEYSAIDTASKSLIALSNDVYSDTSLITDISVNEAKEGGGGTVDFDIPEENVLVISSDTNGGSLKCEFPKNGADVLVLGTFKQSATNSLKNSNNESIFMDTNSPNINDSTTRINIIVPTAWCGASYNTRSFNNTASGTLLISLRIILTNSQGAIKILENRKFRYTVE
jgi:hypothetical protein